MKMKVIIKSEIKVINNIFIFYFAKQGLYYDYLKNFEKQKNFMFNFLHK